MNGRRSISLHDNIAQSCTKWGECHFFSCLRQTLATFFSRFSFMTFCFVTSFNVTLYDIVNDRRARIALKQIMLHFQSGTSWRSTLPYHVKRYRHLLSSGSYGHCETYVFAYFHIQHVVTCLDSLRVRGYTFSRMGYRKQWGRTGLFYDRDESTWSDSARRFLVFEFFL